LNPAAETGAAVFIQVSANYEVSFEVYHAFWMLLQGELKTSADMASFKVSVAHCALTLLHVSYYLLTELSLPEKVPIVQPLRKFPAILRNPKVHHRVHKNPPLVPILSQFDPC
jgi:hypothetical protein